MSVFFNQPTSAEVNLIAPFLSILHSSLAALTRRNEIELAVDDFLPCKDSSLFLLGSSLNREKLDIALVVAD